MARPKEFDQNRVLDKAIDVFWCQGFEATSIQDLVENTGVNRQSLYDTFGDKSALFLVALQRYQEMQVAQLETKLEQPGSAKEAIRQLFEETAQNLLDDQARRGCLIVNSTIELASHDTAVATRISTNMLRTHQAFYQALLRAQAQGEFDDKPRNFTALARFLTNNMQGLGITIKVTPDPNVLRDIIEVALSVLD